MKTTTTLLLLTLFSFVGFANNINVTNVSLTGQNTVDGYSLVQFDLGWENSWRLSSGPANYDGAWVFIKYRLNGGNWQHATINYVDGTAAGDGHTAAAGSLINTTSDGVGAFVYRDSNGNGDINYANMELRWNYAIDGVSDDAVIDVQVFAIEMVYIPQGSFELGSSNLGGTESGHFYNQTGVFGAQNPFQVLSEDEIIVSSGVDPSFLYYQNLSGNSGDQTGPIPALFPKGYDAFWIMKYEVTEDQWICFFNSLSASQKSYHDVTDADHKNTDLVASRNTVAYESGNASSAAPNRAISYLDYTDCAAYLDWSGLRFMTEMEYEKSAKGPVHTNNMFASGGTQAHAEVYTIVNDGLENAVITDPGEGITNLCYFETDPGGPMRVGIFAASAVNPTREETGGSYYGVMELSGNLYERCISAGTTVDRAFEGTHGDGELTFTTGDHDVASWPSAAGAGATSFRGGSWANGPEFCMVADRFDGAQSGDLNNSRIGFRGARTATP